ncbi:MAG TPA: hypothetical protein VLT45_11700, partial [Kofleriaceae bacterium]|nr:hypothetical protein [Kofleriaceae bacterium]
MMRFAVLAAALAAACSSSSGTSDVTWSWSFADIQGCPALVSTIDISVTQRKLVHGECFEPIASLASVQVPCSDGQTTLRFSSSGPHDPCPATGEIDLTLDALTPDGGIYAEDTRRPYDERSGQSAL